MPTCPQQAPLSGALCQTPSCVLSKALGKGEAAGGVGGRAGGRPPREPHLDPQRRRPFHCGVAAQPCNSLPTGGLLLSSSAARQ
eukprot:4266071-Prymnesium_polylepis.1